TGTGQTGTVPKLRLASALVIPPPAATEIDGLRRACGDGMLARVDPHVTLVEPINVRDDALDEVEQVLREAAARAPGPLTLRFGPARSFHPDSAVLYLAVDGDLDDLAGLRTVMRTGPFDRGATWPFVPHVTIGTDLSEQRLEAGVTALADYSVTVTFTHVQVLQEQRDADEVRRWRPIADATLGGRTVSGRGGIELEVTEAAGAGFAFTARHGGEVIGEARGWVDDGMVRVAWLAVREGERGIGVGRRLLAACEDFGRARAAGRLVTARSVELDDFLRARGWHDDGEGMVRDL
ncbi:MAG TPA: GNAT family N-acetyltransferase, partial [Acidimicrobiales bacterium]|nr:GNAT family N-acetyltransferase [Acidimicrobiales bacterium]